MHSGKFYLLILFSAIGFNAFAQTDSDAFIADYPKPNNVELSNAYNSTSLHFYTRKDKAEVANFFSNNGLFSGVYLNYKWLIVGYGINVPFTSRDKAVKGFKSYNFHFRSYYHGWGFSASSDIYKGLLSQTYKNNYTPLKGVRYTNLSADIFRVGNAQKYSYKAAQYLGQQQLKNCGSFLFHIRPSYYALGLQTNGLAVTDSVKGFISDNPRWLSLIGSVGYGYNIVWNNGKCIISPHAETGLGGLYQFGIENKLKPAAFVKAALAAGFGTGNIYLYLNAETTNSTNFFAATTLADDRLRLSVTAGYRLYNLKKKVLGLL